MVCFGLYRVFFIFIAECELKRRVTVSVFCFNLGYNAGASFNNGAGGLPSISAEDAGHPDLFSNNSFHLFAVLAPHGCKDIPIVSGFQSSVCRRPFLLFPEAFRERSTGSKQTSKGLFICIPPDP